MAYLHIEPIINLHVCTCDEILRCDSRRIGDDVYRLFRPTERSATVLFSLLLIVCSVHSTGGDGDGFVGVAVRGYTHDYFVANLVVPRLIRRGSDILAIGDDLVAV